MKIAVLCSGQGSQFPGMALDFLATYPELKSYFDLTSSIVGEDVTKVLNDAEKINQTKYTQPLMVLTSSMIYDLILRQGVKPAAITGFSLGEFSAIYASGILDFETTQKIVAYRAQVMQTASQTYPGKMAAILGLEHHVVEDVCKSVSTKADVVVPVNYNTANQLVISGSVAAVELACEKLKATGAKRALMLNVSGAFHSPYMAEAGHLLKTYAEKFEYKKPNYPLYLNTTAMPLVDQVLPTVMETQIQSPVLFMQTIHHMIKADITHFIEVGPGQVLSNLVKKINPEVVAVSVSTVTDLEKLKEIISC